MTVHEWPLSLPCQPIQQGLAITLNPNYWEFKPDQGKTYRRQKASNATDIYVVHMVLTDDQLSTFLNFYRGVCGDGVDDFYINDWRHPSFPKIQMSWADPDPDPQRIGAGRWGVNFGVECLAPVDYGNAG